MPARQVLKYPDPRLRTVCPPVMHFDEELRQVIADLAATMDASGHSVGIAAPQIGLLVRIVIIDCSQRPEKNLGRRVLVNPEITVREGRYTMREGCMSLPDYVGIVTRARWVQVRAWDPDGQPFEVQAQKFEAVVLQHEIDHLDGILFIDRVSCLKTDLLRRSELIKKPKEG